MPDMQTNTFKLYKDAEYLRTIFADTVHEAVAQVTEVTSSTFVDFAQTMSYQWDEDTPFEVIEVK